MIKDVGLDVSSPLTSLQEKHLGTRGIHLQEVGVCLEIEMPPTPDEIIVQPIQLLTLLRIRQVIVRLIIVEPMVALADFDVRLEARNARKRQIHRVERRAEMEVREVADLPALHDDRAIAEMGVGL